MAFVGKEIIETLRRPGAIVSLILGPFLIMAVFGLGYSGVKRPLETIIVVAADERPADRRRDLPGARRRRAARRGGRAAIERRPRRACGAGPPTSSSSPPRIRRRSSGPASSRCIEVLDRRRRPGRGELRGLPGVGPGVGRQPRDHPSGRPPRARATRSPRANPRPRPSRPTSSRPRPAPRSTTSRRRTPNVICVLRAGGPRAHPPAPGRHARRDVARPRADERRDRAVPHRARSARPRC